SVVLVRPPRPAPHPAGPHAGAGADVRADDLHAGPVDRRRALPAEGPGGARLRLGAVRLLQSRRHRARREPGPVGAQAAGPGARGPGRAHRPAGRRGGAGMTLDIVALDGSPGAATGDGACREQIAHSTGETLFVNAGAGSGKTTALVERVASLVIDDGVPMAHIAAVTFTEKAGAELRDRLRERFERIRRERGPAAERADTALNDLDGAAIGTLHAFAQRILTEHPVEAGIPPLIEVLDEVGSSVAFDERWNGLQTDLLDDDSIARPLLTAMAAGMKTTQLRSLSLALGRDWDLIGERILDTDRPALVMPDLEPCLGRARRLLTDRELCTVSDDRLLLRLGNLAERVEAFDR